MQMFTKASPASVLIFFPQWSSPNGSLQAMINLMRGILNQGQD